MENKKSTAKAATENPSKKLKSEPHYECKGCGHKSYEVITSLPTQYYEGFAPDGSKYTSIRRSTVVCKDCGQRSIVMAYDFDAAAWKE